MRKLPISLRYIYTTIIIIVLALAWTAVPQKTSAAQGIPDLINFQGKIVNSDGTNVADGNYNITFKIWDAATDGSTIWTETRTGGNQVEVSGGIFRVQLGSVQALPGSVDFNTDNLYLGIAFNGDSEMTPRVQFTSVPYAFNAEKVNGLTVTNTSDLPFSTTTTLKIADGKTVAVNAGLTFSGTDSTTFTFPASGGNIVTEDFTQSLTNKTIGSTGLTFSGAPTDIATVTNEDFSIVPNGTGKVNINTTSGLASFDVRANSEVGGTLAVASVSGATSFASLVVDNTGLGDIFTASTGGVPKFTINNSGSIKFSNYTLNGGVFYADTTGNLLQTAVGDGGQCLQSVGGGAPTWGSCGGAPAGGGSNWTLSTVNGTLSPNNNTLDFLWGGISTDSAKFAILGIADTGATNNPSASVSAITGNNAGNGVALFGNGSIQSLRNNTLTLGGATTGDIAFKPGNVSAPSLTLASNGFVGIGTTSPAQKLNLYDTTAINSGTKSTQRIFTTFTPSSTNYTSSIEGLNIYTELNSSTAVDSTDGSAYIRGFFSEAPNFSSKTINATYGGTSASGIGGGASGGITNAYGWHGYVYQNGTGTITNAFPFFSEIRSTGNGTIDTGVNFYADVSNSLGTINTVIGFKNNDASSLVGNQYGILAYGKSRFGDTSYPTAMVEVAGDLNVVGRRTGKALVVFDETGDQAILTASAAGVTKFILTNTGNIGIGTSTPTTNLDISGSASVSANLGLYGAGDAHTFNIFDNGSLNIQRSAGGDAGLATALFVQNNGNVGIGTSLPGAPLEIYKNGSGSDNTGGGIILARYDGSGVNYRGGAIYSRYISAVSADAMVFGVTLVDGKNPYSDFDQARMALLYDGRLGVGNTAPTVNLDVGPITLGASEVVQIRVGDFLMQSQQGAANGITALTTRGSNGNLTLDGAAGSGFYTSPFSTNNNFLVSGGGKVIVGSTADPTATFDIRATSGTLPVASVSGVTAFAGLVVDNSGSGDIFTASSSGLNRFVITNQGNVGIGKVNPGVTLDVVGAGQFSTSVTSPTYTGTDAVTLSSGGTSGLTFDSASGDITVSANDGLTFAATTAGNNGSVNLTINAGSTGTTATLLIKLDTSGTVVTTNTTTLNEAVGVALDTKSSGQAVRVATQGVVTVTADNTVAAGDYIGVGTTTAGRAKSLGTTYPTTTGVQVIGRALSGASAGSTFLLMLNGLDNNAGGGGGGANEAQVIFFSNAEAVAF
ncbi:MAG: hypothetical protein COX79_01975 [Candidatus Levybacteria bacterium CG_4_10_14_0_2_um_filter_36_16]|nr:MAG: hypothetical protein AUK12_02600 [Candidatus Levybacteria bacterium CG2_30_37_29]PIR79042.1 MAG: hypothetical protein COU26_03250 [Candidatus Levybacteria bacterium CG10_big_fil_rev_8_21_14_0_10_36_30]PIZ97499.1 MAG: hypothetical protein COX79_01975 [Candidatus Levybacteria bacterium CG_4_10_14_0_2_um_filter_36_16]